MSYEHRIDDLAMKRIAEEVSEVFELTSCDATTMATTIGRISGMIDLATDIKNEIFRELQGEEMFIVNITLEDHLRTLGTLGWEIDKTYREVKKAFLSGKRIYAKCHDVLYGPASYSFGKANPHITWHIKINGITRNIGLHPGGSFNLELEDETRNNITKGDDSKC